MLSADLFTLRICEWFNLPKTTCTKQNVSALQQSLVSADARNCLCSCLLKQGVHSIPLLWPVCGISSAVIANKNVSICDGCSAAEAVCGWKACPNSSSWNRSSVLFQQTLHSELSPLELVSGSRALNTHYEGLTAAGHSRDMRTKGDSSQPWCRINTANCVFITLHSTEFQLCVRIPVLVWSTEVSLWDVNVKTHTWAHRNTQSPIHHVFRISQKSLKVSTPCLFSSFECERGFWI